MFFIKEESKPQVETAEGEAATPSNGEVQPEITEKTQESS